MRPNSGRRGRAAANRQRWGQSRTTTMTPRSMLGAPGPAAASWNGSLNSPAPGLLGRRTTIVRERRPTV
jgi:hypothetical protein